MLTRHDEAAWVIAGKLSCTGGQATRGKLAAGTYQFATFGSWGSAEWSGLDVADGERRVFHLQRPSGPALHVEWPAGLPDGPPPAFVGVVRSGGLTMHYADPEALVVPPGSDVWLCGAEGCCHHHDPPARVRCEPSQTVLPPMPRM